MIRWDDWTSGWDEVWERATCLQVRAGETSGGRDEWCSSSALCMHA